MSVIVRSEEIELGKCIGKGAFGVVFRGKFRGRVVAVKKLLVDIDPDENMLMEFHQEISLCSRLHHENIVEFLAACLDRDNVCLVTEFCALGNLRQLIRNNDFEWSWPVVVSFALDAASGMHYLHRQANPPLMHRDLKSANLLVTKDFRLKIADFGLAKIADISRAKQSLAGTYEWMAPEMMEGKRYDEKVDVYSFGIVLWEMCSKQLPFEQFNNEVALARAVVDRGERPMVPKGTPSGLATLMTRCWQGNPAARPSFFEIVDTLRIMSTFDPRAAVAQPQAQASRLPAAPPPNNNNNNNNNNPQHQQERRRFGDMIKNFIGKFFAGKEEEDYGVFEQCPICGKNIPWHKANEHANRCLDAQTSNPPPPPQQQQQQQVAVEREPPPRQVQPQPQRQPQQPQQYQQQQRNYDNKPQFQPRQQQRSRSPPIVEPVGADRDSRDRGASVDNNSNNNSWAPPEDLLRLLARTNTIDPLEAAELASASPSKRAAGVSGGYHSSPSPPPPPHGGGGYNNHRR